MGNSLHVENVEGRDNVIREGNGDKYILNKTVNDFFKNRPDPLSSSVIDRASYYSKDQKEILKRSLKQPLWARGCCSLETSVPIALPYVYPYNGSAKEVQTAYPRVLLTKGQNNLKSICRSKFNGRVGSIKFNMIPRKDGDHSYSYKRKNFFSDNATQCQLFYGAKSREDFVKKRGGELGLCSRVFSKRKSEKPKDIYYQMYGSASKIDGDYVKKKLTSKGEKKIRLRAGYHNAYPECSCINSQFLKTDASVVGETTGKIASLGLSGYQANTLQQKQDINCTDQPFNSTVDQVVKGATMVCVNICNKCKALAINGSKVRISQTCQTNLSKAPRNTNHGKINAMDAEDKKKENAKRKAEIAQNRKLVEDTQRKLKEQEALAKAADKKRKEEDAKRRKEDAKRRAAEDKRRKEDAERRAAEDKRRAAEDKRRAAEFDARQKKLEALIAKKSGSSSNNMMVIGILVLLLIVVGVIMMTTMSKKSTTTPKSSTPVSSSMELPTETPN